MSYKAYRNEVLDPTVPLHLRMCAFGSCIQIHKDLIRRGHRETLERFVRTFGLQKPADVVQPEVSESALLAAMEALDRERSLFHARLKAFRLQRLRLKQQSRRPPSESEIEALYAPDFFVTQ